MGMWLTSSKVRILVLSILPGPGIKVKKMVGRTVAFADIQGMGDSAGDVVLGLLNRIRKGSPFGQIGGNRRGKSTAGTVGVGGIQALRGQVVKRLAVIKDVRGLVAGQLNPGFRGG